jgi:hypothetical protein
VPYPAWDGPVRLTAGETAFGFGTSG